MPGVAPGATLAQQVPELVEMDLERAEALLLVLGERRGVTRVPSLERVLLVDELVDLLDDLAVVSS